MRKPLFLTLFATLLLFAGCGNDDSQKDGSIDITWAIGGTTCGASGISIVEISVYDKDGIYNASTVACQLGRLEVQHIPAGTYYVRVDGLQSTSAVPIYEGVIPDVRVLSGDVTIIPKIYLAEKPGGIDLSWKFHDGDLCRFSGVDTITVNVWDSHSNRVFQDTMACDSNAAAIEEEEQTPISSTYDMAKGVVIDGLFAGEYTVELFAHKQGVDLHPVYWGNATAVQTIHGRLTPVDVVLNPCDGDAICF